MASVDVTVDVALVLAVVLAELISILYFNDSTPWGRRFNKRYLVSAIISDVILVLLIRFFTQNYYSVNDVESAVRLSVGAGLLYICLEAPHCVRNADSLVHFIGHAFHKALIVFVVAFSLFYFKNIKI